MRFFEELLLALSLLILIAGAAHAADLSIGCAANFTSAMKDLSAMYEQETGKETNLTFGSTGMLYGQITKGAPYDLFFAADETRPDLLHAEGLAEAPQLYALGKLVFWTMHRDMSGLSTWQDAVTAASMKHIGMANPKTAPYGQRAVEALDAAGLLASATPRLSYGKSVGVAFQFAYSEAADGSFVALSQALSGKGGEGVWWPVPEAAPVRQAVCTLKSGNQAEATAFLAWMQTEKARTVIEQYGYE